MDSKRLTAEALRGIETAAEGNTSDTPMAFRSMLRSLLADRAALEQRVGELVEAALHLYDEPPHEIYGIAQIPVENLLRLTAAAKALADGEGT